MPYTIKIKTLKIWPLAHKYIEMCVCLYHTLNRYDDDDGDDVNIVARFCEKTISMQCVRTTEMDIDRSLIITELTTMRHCCQLSNAELTVLVFHCVICQSFHVNEENKGIHTYWFIRSFKPMHSVLLLLLFSPHFFHFFHKTNYYYLHENKIEMNKNDTTNSWIIAPQN